ncbi:multidrug effflux MFS transporter [Pengzhenrongella sp.]|jgi:DHA1 family bicyclomycin/chloramphenicol resistance-like MFS transporter|uniref:multidrug effflux MFS transporter n=1 Tax=Pengzhenrongella sp. TaxID=2888820 RepID=UPI002F9571CA
MTTTISHTGHALSRKSRLIYVIVLGLLVGLGPFTIDLYLPAFPAVQADLGASASAVQVTLTATMIGFGVGQLIVGPWSDMVGRRRPLLLATALHVGASLGVALAPDIGWIVVFRVLQGVGAAGGGVVATAVVRDLFEGRPLIRMFARLALVTGVAPVVAPVIGSQLLRFLDWRGLFVVVACYGVVVLVLAFAMITETLPAERRQGRGGRTTAARLRSLFADRAFIGVALIGGLLVAGVFCYLSSSPFLFQELYGLDAQQYGMLGAINAIVFVVGSQSASRIIHLLPPQWLLAVTLPLLALAGYSIILCVALGLGLTAILAVTSVFFLGAGMSVPCLQVLGLAHHADEAGTAAAVLGATNFAVAGIAAPIVGAIGLESAAPMGLVMGTALTIATGILWTMIRPRTVRSIY